jgi:hypothetical protein
VERQGRKRVALLGEPKPLGGELYNHAACRDLVHESIQVCQAAGQPIQAVDDQRIAGSQMGKAGLQARSIRATAAGVIFEYPV